MEATTEAVMVVYSSYSFQAKYSPQSRKMNIWSDEKTNSVEVEATEEKTPVVAVVEAKLRLSVENADR